MQCEPGPQDGTLLITWTPVTSQPKPPSRAAVSGYLVYADGRKVAEVNTPTGDHVLLRLSEFIDDPPLFITVRTRTKEGAVSADSNVVRVPRSLVSTSSISPRRTLMRSNTAGQLQLPYANTVSGRATRSSTPNDMSQRMSQRHLIVTFIIECGRVSYHLGKQQHGNVDTFTPSKPVAQSG